MVGVRTAYDSLEATEHVDPFKKEVFNLIGHCQPASQGVDPAVLPRMQDFVWQKLCLALASGPAAGEWGEGQQHVLPGVLHCKIP